MFEIIPYAHHMHRMNAYDPFTALDQLQRSFFDNDTQLAAFRTDVKENENEFILEAELPGFNKEDIELSIEDGCLTISAERKDENEEKQEHYVKRERFYGSYKRSFDLSGIDVDKISASYENGILSLELPKIVETAPEVRKLQIN